MFVGLLSAPMMNWSFKKLVDWSSINGFKGLELFVSPNVKQLNIDDVLDGDASKIRRLIKDKDMEITSLAFYSIKILEDVEDQKFLEKVIDACTILDIDVICTLAGGRVANKDKIRTIEEEFPKVFNPLVDKAKEQGLKIALENWFATNLQGLNHFQTLFDIIPDKTLGLNFDPSHLLWQQIDYINAVYRFGNRIHHTHAKDTEILDYKLREIGVLSGGWWRYRIPGWGRVDWPAYITALKEVGYDYVLSIEHEDQFFNVEDGFLKAKIHLERFL
jgi:sugar phosphate isomerase/epimerase